MIFRHTTFNFFFLNEKQNLDYWNCQRIVICFKRILCSKIVQGHLNAEYENRMRT